MLRSIDQFVDLSDIRRHLAPFYSSTGRPSVDPEAAPHTVREYLETLDDDAFGAVTPVQPKFTSHSDPASQWTAARIDIIDVAKISRGERMGSFGI